MRFSCLVIAITKYSRICCAEQPSPVHSGCVEFHLCFNCLFSVVFYFFGNCDFSPPHRIRSGNIFLLYQIIIHNVFSDVSVFFSTATDNLRHSGRQLASPTGLKRSAVSERLSQSSVMSRKTRSSVSVPRSLNPAATIWWTWLTRTALRTTPPTPFHSHTFPPGRTHSTTCRHTGEYFYDSQWRRTFSFQINKRLGIQWYLPQNRGLMLHTTVTCSLLKLLCKIGNGNDFRRYDPAIRVFELEIARASSKSIGWSPVYAQWKLK